MYERYGKVGCPSDYPVRSKCVALFQKIHGVDVLLFGMYVYEYGQNCPGPNRRRVYISYLDSVKYFAPKCYRTTAYHALLTEYLRYVKNRGFHTAHIWSCPPSSGDDYIFHCHPPHQRIPRDDMLRNWYTGMLDKARADGIVLDVKTMYDEYFKNDGQDATAGPATDPTSLPYFEGDYIPGEIENIIKHLTAEEAKRKDRGDTMGGLAGMSKKVGNKLGTRSNPGELVNVGQDKVMLRLGQALSNMRQNFMVVHLRSRAFAAAVERGDDVSSWTEDSVDSSKRAKIGGKDSSMLYGSGHKPHNTATKKMSSVMDGSDTYTVSGDDRSSGTGNAQVKTEEDNTQQDKHGSTKSSEKDTDRSQDDIGSLGTVSVSLDPHDDDPNRAFGVDSNVNNNNNNGSGTGDKDDLMPIPLGDLGGQKSKSSADAQTLTSSSSRAGSKRGFDEIEPAISRHFSAMGAAGVGNTSVAMTRKLVPSTDDEDDPQESEMFESRQQFLNHCQANNFQFDELRRAKHTTMMVLFQLHNPNAPAFSSMDSDSATGKQKNRGDRTRTIKAHLKILEHAATCNGPRPCSLRNCEKMKKLLEHAKTCTITPKKLCKKCTLVLTLLTVHARTCTERNSCPLPFCDRIREKIKRRTQLQQLMDDRRRQAQNELYRAPAPAQLETDGATASV